MHEHADEAISLVTPEAERKGLALNIEINEALPAQVLGDRLRESQAFGDFLSNAVKFTDFSQVKFPITVQNDGLALETTDSGIVMT